MSYWDVLKAIKISWAYTKSKTFTKPILLALHVHEIYAKSFNFGHSKNYDGRCIVQYVKWWQEVSIMPGELLCCGRSHHDSNDDVFASLGYLVITSCY